MSDDDAQQLLFQYRSVIQGMLERGQHALPLEHLPASKEQIKKALLIALANVRGDSGRTKVFTGAYVNLSRFQPGVRENQTNLNRAIAGTSPTDIGSLENYARQMEQITAEEANLRAELKAAGFSN